jgi:hypothetical protein
MALQKKVRTPSMLPSQMARNKKCVGFVHIIVLYKSILKLE